MTARPARGPPPGGAPGRSARRWHRAVPRRCVASVACRGRRRRLRGLPDGRHPWPGSGAAASPRPATDAPRRWPQGGRPGVWRRGRSLRRGWPPGGRPSRPRPGGAAPLLAAGGGVTARQLAPHPGAARGGVGRLPRPVDPAQRVTGLDQHGPETGEATTRAPRLDVAGPGAVAAHSRWPVMPLAAGPPAHDDAVEDPPALHSPLPLGLGGILSVHHGLDHRPHGIRDLPDGGGRYMVTRAWSQSHPPLGEEGDRPIRSRD